MLAPLGFFEVKLRNGRVERCRATGFVPIMQFNDEQFDSTKPILIVEREDFPLSTLDIEFKNIYFGRVPSCHDVSDSDRADASSLCVRFCDSKHRLVIIWVLDSQGGRFVPDPGLNRRDVRI